MQSENHRVSENSALSSGVFAVVVTYNPGQYLASHLEAIRSQVSNVLIVDNGSHDGDIVRAVAERTGCAYRSNERNLGIAAALNQGAAAAIRHGATWLAMFDQDSEPPPDSINSLLQTYANIENHQRVAILAMSHRDRGTGRDYHLASDILLEQASIRTVKTTITSGSMLLIDAYKALGPFDEQLFIDSVDLEYCLRARNEGYEVVESRSTYLAHSIGDAELRVVFGREYMLTHHSAERRYYITRNQLRVLTRYARFDPRWSMNALLHLTRLNVAVLLLENDRMNKLMAMLQAVRDFTFGRFGPRR